jgi:glyoxylase-like metal-dependent hydrolase (beta-lactamase superfamily II)
MKIVPIIGDTDSNSYLIIDKKTALVDTGAGLDNRIESLVRSEVDKVDLIINTHAHYDHCAGNLRFPEAKVYLHRDDAGEMLNGRFYGTYKFFGEELPMKFHKLIQGGDRIYLGEMVLDVIHTPGHTYGSICLYDEDRKALFTGDTLFEEGIGRVDLGGDINMMESSLNKISELRVETLFPGHGRIVSEKSRVERAVMDAKRLFFGD